jgi:TatD DNase family protein
MLIDTHCHLNFPDFGADLNAVIGNARKAGVKRFIVPGVDITSSESSVRLAGRHPGIVYASVGIHPYETEHNPDLNLIDRIIRKNITVPSHFTGTQFFPKSNVVGRQSPACTPLVAVGECGLDYHLYRNENAIGKKDRQKKLFEGHLKLALTYGLPVIIHCRDAFSDLFDVLDSLPTAPRGVLHCFSGGLQDLRMAIGRNLYVGIDGNITYSRQLSGIIGQIPLPNLLLETDAPYLTPVPRRGRRNEPKYLVYTLKKVSQITGLSPATISEKTSENAFSLFHFS